LVVKVQEAMRYKPSYIQVTVPCVTTWRYSPDKGVQISRLMVQTGLLPLWRYKEGVFKRTVRVPKDKRAPLNDYLKLQERYSHLNEKDVKDIQDHIDRQDKLIDSLEQALTVPNGTVSW
jgi:pyruvate ferredoxin oxidoreductase beta subunit